MSAAAPLYRRLPDVRWRVLDGEAVVLRQRADEVLGLNAVGARVLELCDGTRALDGLLAALAAEFEVEPATLASDVERFLAELVAAGVLEPVTPEPAR